MTIDVCLKIYTYFPSNPEVSVSMIANKEDHMFFLNTTVCLACNHYLISYVRVEQKKDTSMI